MELRFQTTYIGESSKPELGELSNLCDLEKLGLQPVVNG